MRILAIAGNTFRECVRDKILYNLVLFALVMILSAVALGQLTLGHEGKVIIGLGLASISIFGTMISVFIGIGLVHKELERRTVYNLLSKPIHRYELIVGKYFGLLFTLAVNVTVMAAGLLITMWWAGGMPLQSYARILPAICVIFLSLALTTAMALLFSTFSTPALSAVFTLFLWVIGHFSGDLLEFGRLLKSPAVQRLCLVLYYAIPNLGNYTMLGSQDVIQGAAYGRALYGADLLLVSSYSLVYCTALLSLAVLVFSRRDMK